MKTIAGIAGIFLIIVGITWFLQGINVLPGSIMTGQIQWAIFGVLAIALGAALAIFGRGGRPKPK